jgi:uncharacterized protein with HEPN domain
MLAAERNDLVHLLNILEYIGKIWQYTKDIQAPEDLYNYNDQLNLNASLNLLANIGECVNKISAELKTKFPAIRWPEITAFRNQVVHNYLGIDLVIAYGIIKNDLKTLKAALETIIKTNIQEKIFSLAELKLAKDSKFYLHVDFKNIL